MILETLAGDPEDRPPDAASLRRTLDAFREAQGLRIGREAIAAYLRGGGPSGDDVLPRPEPDPVPDRSALPGDHAVSATGGVPEPPTPHRRRKPLVVAFLLASAVGVAAFIMGGMREDTPGSTPPRGRAGRQTLQPEPGSTGEGPAGWSPGSAPGMRPAEAAAPVPLRGAERDRAETPPPLRAVPPPASGLVSTLDIQCTPWAVVFIDGDSVDTTPLKRSIPVAPGAHVLEMRNPVFPAVRREILLGPGEARALRLSLWDHVGRLHVTAKPWARIYVDGAYAETTPIQGPLVLAPGTHHLQFEHPSLEPMEEEVVVVGGEEIRVSVDLEKRLQERE